MLDMSTISSDVFGERPLGPSVSSSVKGEIECQPQKVTGKLHGGNLCKSVYIVGI